MRRFPVEYEPSPAIPDWRFQCNDAVSCRCLCVNTIRDIGLLEDPQLHVGLLHCPQCVLESPVYHVTDVVHPKADHFLPVSSHPSLVPLCMNSCTPTFSWPTDDLSPCHPVFPPARPPSHIILYYPVVPPALPCCITVPSPVLSLSPSTPPAPIWQKLRQVLHSARVPGKLSVRSPDEMGATHRTSQMYLFHCTYIFRFSSSYCRV